MSTSNTESNTESTPAPIAQPTTQDIPLCTSRLAVTIMQRHQDEWIMAVAIAITEAQALIDAGASETTANVHADDIIEAQKIVDAELLRCVQDFSEHTGTNISDEELVQFRCSALVALATGQTISEIMTRIHDRFPILAGEPLPATAEPDDAPDDAPSPAA